MAVLASLGMAASAPGSALRRLGSGVCGAGAVSCQQRRRAPVLLLLLLLLLLGCAASGRAEETLPGGGGSWDAGVGSCGAAFCQHRGDCYGWDVETGGHQCRCWKGYEGPFCETDTNECAPSLCRNRAACAESGSHPSVAAGEYRCDCRPGYSGSKCEVDVDECASDPCAHGGVCSELVDAYSCRCARGYAGADCTVDVDECAPSPCLNGAGCLESGRDASVAAGTRRCRCISGYTGVHCEIDLLDPCTSSPCTNNATCIVAEVGSGVVEVGFECGCKPGFSGQRCEACAEGYAGRFCEPMGPSASKLAVVASPAEDRWLQGVLFGLSTVALVPCLALLLSFVMPAGCHRGASEWSRLAQDYCRLCCGFRGNSRQHRTTPAANWLRVGPHGATQGVYYYNLQTGEQTTTLPRPSPSRPQTRLLEALHAEQQPLQPRSPVVPRQLDFLEEDIEMPHISIPSTGSRQFVSPNSYSPSIVGMEGNTMNPLWAVHPALQQSGGHGAQQLPTPLAAGTERALTQQNLLLAGTVTRVYRRWLEWLPDDSGSRGNDYAAGYGLRLRSKTSPLAVGRGGRGSWPVVDAALNGAVFDGEPGEENGVRSGHIVLRVGKHDARLDSGGAVRAINSCILLANKDVEAELQPRESCACELLCPWWPKGTEQAFSDLPGAATQQFHEIEWVFAVVDTSALSADSRSPADIRWRPEPEPVATHNLQLVPATTPGRSGGYSPDVVSNICRREDLGSPSPDKVRRTLEQHRHSSNPTSAAIKALRADFHRTDQQQHPTPGPQHDPRQNSDIETETDIDTTQPQVKPFAQRIVLTPSPNSGSSSLSPRRSPRSHSRSPVSTVDTRPSRGDKKGGYDTGRQKKSRKIPSPPRPPAHHYKN